MANAGKRQVRGRDPVPLLGGVGVLLLALCRGSFAVGIESDRHRRLRELNGRDMHQVAPYHQSLALAFDHVDRVARCVAVSRNGGDAWYKIGVAVERLELTRRNIRIN